MCEARETMDTRKLIVRAADRTTANEQAASHPFNPDSQVLGHELAEYWERVAFSGALSHSR